MSDRKNYLDDPLGIIKKTICELDADFRKNATADPGAVLVGIYIYFLSIMSEDDRRIAIHRITKLNQSSIGNKMDTKKDLKKFFEKLTRRE